jgi:pimeloyl-ACP methyl ester carboxylesterase
MRLPVPAPLAAAALLALAPAPARAGAPVTPQTRSQQKCVTSFGAGAAAVTKARAAENRRCFEAHDKGTLDKLGAASLRSCLARDPKGKVAKQAAKLEKRVEKSCTDAEDVPDFGLGAGGAPRASYTAAAQTTATILDLLSENLFAAAADCDADEAGCKCQAGVTDAAAKLAGAKQAEFERCAKAVLKSGAGTIEALGNCLTDPAQPGSVAADTKHKLAKQREKLAKAATEGCAGVASDNPLPGACVGQLGADLADCVDAVVECRVCLTLRAVHGLTEDCDSFDNGASDGSCPAAAIVQETLAIPSEAEPAETPGTAGVVVTQPQLIAQFGGADFDLNNATYTRYHWRALATQPDAILVLVPGFEGGAGGFKPLAENLLPRALVEHGQVLEVWAFDRRSHQLEDLAGLDLAEQAQDPQLALDWLFGGALGLPPFMPLGRRAEFYDAQGDIPFLANWTPLVHSQDIDAVVEAARVAARDGNVFLGGHSAGTGFAARYASTDFDLTGAGPEEPGYAKLRGLVLIEGGGGSAAGAAPSEDTLDLIEAKFAGGLFGAVRDDAPRCMDGVTPCTEATEETDCAAFEFDLCVPPTTAYAQFFPLSPQLLSSSEPMALQGAFDPDGGQAILQVEQGGMPGNTAVAKVPELGILAGALPQGTAEGVIGRFVDDDGFFAASAAFVAMSAGAPGPKVPDDPTGLATWLDLDESAAFPACPGAECVTPDNGPEPTTLTPPLIWGVEQEQVRFERLMATFYAGGTNFTDWYYPSSGLSVTQGLPGLDSSALSADAPVGRGRRDIENLVEAAAIDVPVIAFGGSNGLTPVPGAYVPFASTIAVCSAPSCDGTTPRVVDGAAPNPAFPMFGDVAGGFEVHITEGFSHVDPLVAEDSATNQVVGPLGDFLARNAP